MGISTAEDRALVRLRIALCKRLSHASQTEISQILTKILEPFEGRELEVWEIYDMISKVSEGLPWSELF